MNNITAQQMDHETRGSNEFDEQKLAEGRLQLEDEADARKRRIKLRKQHQAKLNAKRTAKRRARTFRLAGVWMTLFAGGFFAIAWFFGDIANLFAK